MNKYILSLLVSVLCCSCFNHYEKPEDLPLKSASKFAPLKPSKWKLENGLEVQFLKDEELPRVSATLYIPKGTLFVDDEDYAATVAVGSLMRAGAGDFSANELDLVLNKLSASVSASIGGEYSTASFSCLSTDLEEVFSIYSDVIFRPRFEESRFSLWKSQAIQGVKRRTDDPQTVASISFSQLLYGKTPYARLLVESDLQNLKRDDLFTAYKKILNPHNALLMVTGNIEESQIKELISKHLGKWSTQDKTENEIPKLNWKAKPGIYFIKKDTSQSQVLIGQRSVSRKTKEYMNIKVFNEIFGTGGFSSRLLKKIRVDSGLAYVTYGLVAPDVNEGLNKIMIQTKSESTGQAIKEAFEVLESLRTDLVSDKELTQHKRSLINSFIFAYDTPGKLLNRLAILKLLDFPKDYDSGYSNNISNVSRQDIYRVANEIWNPDEMIVLVVGNNEAFQTVKETFKDSKYSFVKNIEEKTFDQELNF